MTERLLTADEVAERLHCTRRYVLRLARAGAFERVKPPGRKTVLFRESSIDAYIESGRQAPVDVGASAARLAAAPAELAVRPRRRERFR